MKFMKNNAGEVAVGINRDGMRWLISAALEIITNPAQPDTTTTASAFRVIEYLWIKRDHIKYVAFFDFLDHLRVVNDHIPSTLNVMVCKYDEDIGIKHMKFTDPNGTPITPTGVPSISHADTNHVGHGRWHETLNHLVFSHFVKFTPAEISNAITGFDQVAFTGGFPVKTCSDVFWGKVLLLLEARDGYEAHTAAIRNPEKYKKTKGYEAAPCEEGFAHAYSCNGVTLTVPEAMTVKMFIDTMVQLMAEFCSGKYHKSKNPFYGSGYLWPRARDVMAQYKWGYSKVEPKSHSKSKTKKSKAAKASEATS